MAGRAAVSVVEITAGRAQDGIDHARGHRIGDAGIDAVVGAAMDRRDDEREPVDTRDCREHPVEPFGQQRRERLSRDRALPQVDLNRLERLGERARRTAGPARAVGADRGRQRRKDGRVLGRRNVFVVRKGKDQQLACLGDDPTRHRLERGKSLQIVGFVPDQIGRSIEGDPASKALP